MGGIIRNFILKLLGSSGLQSTSSSGFLGCKNDCSDSGEFVSMSERLDDMRRILVDLESKASEYNLDSMKIRLNNLEEKAGWMRPHVQDFKRFKRYSIASSGASLSFKADFFSATLLLFMFSCIAVLVVGFQKRDVKLFCEYMAYVLPLIAGVVAGSGMYMDKPALRRLWRRESKQAKSDDSWSGNFKAKSPDVACFQASALLLFLSLIFFVGSKSIFSDFYLSIFGLLGTFVSIFSVVINYRNMRLKPTKVDSLFRPVAITILAANVVASLVWIAIIGTNSTGWPVWMRQLWQWLQKSMQ